MPELLNAMSELLISAVAALDMLPGYLRALLAGLILALLLGFWERRLDAREVLYSVSFRKTAFVALLLIPPLVWLFPDSRMVVFVDELPDRSASESLFWLVIPTIWGCGFLIGLQRFVQGWMRAYGELQTRPELPEQQKLHERLAHWQRKLDLSHPLTLVETTAAQPLHLPAVPKIAFPRAAVHWPASQIDVLLIRELCHIRKRHGFWHLFAQLVACVYWPVTWVQQMHQRLLESFQQAADSLAESCYQDSLGYDRALKQIAQRLAPPRTLRRRAQSQNGGERTLPARLHDHLRAYRSRLSGLLHPEPALVCQFDALVAVRAAGDRVSQSEPYDRVFWFVGQAVFLALLLTGPTLKETPPEIEQDFSLPFEQLWMEHFHRNQERLEGGLPPVEGDAQP